jgi:hypothetical protein
MMRVPATRPEQYADLGPELAAFVHLVTEWADHGNL